MMDDGGAFDMQFDEFGHQSEGKQPSSLGHKRVRGEYTTLSISKNISSHSQILTAVLMNHRL